MNASPALLRLHSDLHAAGWYLMEGKPPAGALAVYRRLDAIGHEVRVAMLQVGNAIVFEPLREPADRQR